MNEEIKQKWIAKLESGEYKRAEGLLKTTKEGEVYHCCLGVLCELHHEETGSGEWRPDPIVGQTYRVSYEGGVSSSTTVLPDSVREWAGMISSTGVFIIKDEEDVEILNKLFEDRRYDIGYEPGLTIINDKSEKEDFSDVIPFIKKYF